jgi:hypothetical protein
LTRTEEVQGRLTILDDPRGERENKLLTMIESRLNCLGRMETELCWCDLESPRIRDSLMKTGQSESLTRFPEDMQENLKVRELAITEVSLSAGRDMLLWRAAADVRTRIEMQEMDL